MECLRQKLQTLRESMESEIAGRDIAYDDDGAFIEGTPVRLKKGWPEKLLTHASSRPRTKAA